MVRDVLMRDINIGDVVVFCDVLTANSTLSVGYLYTVEDLIEQGSFVKVTGLSENNRVVAEIVPSNSILKIVRPPHPVRTPIVLEKMAVAVHRLINSSPRTPYPAEIADCLRKADVSE
jgi:hypothetical protein